MDGHKDLKIEHRAPSIPASFSFCRTSILLFLVWVFAKPMGGLYIHLVFAMVFVPFWSINYWIFMGLDGCAVATFINCLIWLWSFGHISSLLLCRKWIFGPSDACSWNYWLCKFLILSYQNRSFMINFRYSLSYSLFPLLYLSYLSCSFSFKGK